MYLKHRLYSHSGAPWEGQHRAQRQWSTVGGLTSMHTHSGRAGILPTPLVPDPECCHRARCNRLSRRRGAGPALFLYEWPRRPQSLPGISKNHTRVARHSPSGKMSRTGGRCCHRARCNSRSRRRGAGPALCLNGLPRRPRPAPEIFKNHTHAAWHSPSGQMS